MTSRALRHRSIHVYHIRVSLSRLASALMALPLRYPQSKFAIDERHIHVISTRTVLALAFLVSGVNGPYPCSDVAVVFFSFPFDCLPVLCLIMQLFIHVNMIDLT